jgi:hypothetical protein
MVRWQSLNPEAVNSLLGFLADDSPLMTGLREKLGPAVADQVGQKLFEGIALGYNPRKVAAIIQKELGQGLTWTLRTARTAQLYAYREATRASYLANPEIVKGWEWRSARDNRTCMSCLSLDGTHHKPDERLADHHNGRCSLLPDTVTYRDLGLKVAEPPPVVGDTGEAWFRGQSEAQQRAQMGPGKHDAWKAGKFKFGDLSSLADPDPVYGRMRVETPLKDLLKAPVAALRSPEESIRRATVEHGIGLGPDGKLLFETQAGARTAIQLSASQIASLKGGTFVHNHPDESSFSMADLLVANRARVQALRVLTKGATYSLSVGNPAKDWKRLADRFTTTQPRFVKQALADVKAGKLTMAEAQASINHNILTEIARKLGANYRRTPVK